MCTAGINIFEPCAFNLQVQRFMTRANPGRFDAHIGIMVNTPNLIEMAILGPKFYRFGLSDPDLVYAGDIYKYVEYFNNLKGFWVFTMIPLWG